MLKSINLLEHCHLKAVDGDLGYAKDFYFDNEHWTIRYLIVDTGGLLTEHKVLVSTNSFGQVDWQSHRFHLNLTKEKVDKCPSVDLAKPVSRRYEEIFHTYYGYPYYWGGSEMWGPNEFPENMADILPDEKLMQSEEKQILEQPNIDPHLWSVQEIIGYYIQGTDDEIGHITDLLLDTDNWSVRYLVVEAGSWWHGKKVLLDPAWVEKISWKHNKAYVNFTRDKIRNSPEWKPTINLDQEYEQNLHEYYNVPQINNNSEQRKDVH